MYMFKKTETLAVNTNYIPFLKTKSIDIKHISLKMSLLLVEAIKSGFYVDYTLRSGVHN